MILKNEEQEQNSAYLDLDKPRPNSRGSNILHTRYNYCKCLLNALASKQTSLCNTSSREVEQCGVVQCGMLIDNIKLEDDAYSVAVRAVLGGRSSTNVLIVAAFPKNIDILHS